MKEHIKQIIACTQCKDHPSLLMSKDYKHMTCNECSSNFKIKNNAVIINKIEQNAELDINPKVFIPSKGQANWRALNYYATRDFFKKQHSNSYTLDLGSGPQTNLNILRKFKKLISIDFNNFSGVDIVCDFTNGLPIQSESIDTILCSNVLEHMPDPSQLLSEIYRILSPHGQCLILVPFCIKEHQTPYDFYRYTQFGLKKLCNHAGFLKMDIKGIGGTLNIIATQLSLLEQSISNLRISFFRRYFIVYPIIKVFRIVQILITKFVGDPVHPDCPQGFALYLTKT